MLPAFVRLSSDLYGRICIGREGSEALNLEFTYELIGAAGYQRTLLYDQDELPTAEKWLEYLLSPHHWVFQMYRDDGTPIALTWLEACTLTGAQRFGHFTTLGTAPRELAIEAIQLMTYDVVAKFTEVEQYIGITPKCYRHAWKFAQELGFRKLTDLSHGVYCLGKRRDAILSVWDIKNREAVDK